MAQNVEVPYLQENICKANRPLGKGAPAGHQREEATIDGWG